jgi:CBS domain-containing protein
MEVLSFLEKTVPFCHLPKAALFQVCSKLKAQKFPKDSYVFKKGDNSHEVLYLVYQGLAEVIVASENREVGYSFRKPHDIFGETVFLSTSTYPASVKVVRDLSCYLLDVETFEDLCVKHQVFAKFFHRILSERMCSLYQDLILGESCEVTALESNPFRHRLREVMTTPVSNCNLNDSVGKIAALMVKNRISSVAVLDEQGSLAGIITERDLVDKCIALTQPPDAWPTAKDVMDADPVQLAPDALYFQGLMTMVRHRRKHILITEGGLLLGIVTIGDLIKFRSLGTFSIIEDIDSQSTLAGLRRIRPRVESLLNSLVVEKASPDEIYEILTEFNDRIVGKTIKLCEQALAEEGLGLPPVEYCWFTMDSSGRKEQLLKKEQNNGIIFADVPEGKLSETTGYFLKLGEKIVAGLEEVGFDKTQGNVLASSPDWCSSSSVWFQRLETWIADFQPANILPLKKFFDLRPVYGRISLADSLKQFSLELGSQADGMLANLTQDELKSEVPLKLFKKTITGKHKQNDLKINLKTEACAHVVNCIRVFAIREGLTATGTLKRLEELTNKGVIPKEDAEYIDAAYQSLLIFRIKNKLEKLAAGEEPDDYINLAALTKKEYDTLREAFLAASQLQNYTRSVFAGGAVTEKADS